MKNKIFFVPDSNIQINNSFGKIVLKSFNDGDENSNDQSETMSISNGLFDDGLMNENVNLQNNDFGFLDGLNPFASPQVNIKVSNVDAQINGNRRSVNNFNTQIPNEFVHNNAAKRSNSLYGNRKPAPQPFTYLKPTKVEVDARANETKETLDKPVETPPTQQVIKTFKIS